MLLIATLLTFNGFKKMNNLTIFSQRSTTIDFLKGLSIIAVVLYHCGLFTYGYLGVDVFLVIAGYFTTKALVKQQLNNQKIDIIKFYIKRLTRLWPLVLVVCIITLFFAYLWMMPMALKNTAETVAGTSLFFNNVVQYIISSNYWDQSNDFKPLMHTWYIALVFHYYIVYVFLLWCIVKCTNKGIVALTHTIFVIFFLSLCFYFLPVLTVAQKFYLLPARLFEFAAGGIIVLIEFKQWKISKNNIIISLFVLVVLILSINCNLGIEQVRLLFVVLLTQIIIYLSINYEKQKSNVFSHIIIKSISLIGIGSYSIYLWHQVILGFYRYVFNNQLRWVDYIIILLSCAIISIPSYQLFEKRLSKWLSYNKTSKTVGLLSCCALTILLILCSTYIYIKQGLIRDVPELNLYVGSNKNMSPEEYNSMNYSLDIDFPSNEKRNVLVIGDSFARDWLNILKESHVDSLFNLSYHTDIDSTLLNRIELADYIFVANNGEFDLYYPLLKKMMEKQFFRVGGKYFTKRVGIVYNNNRYGTNYYKQFFFPIKDLEIHINNERTIFGDNYIDLMSVIKDKNGNYNYFTPDHHLYSEDGIHLTQAGAKEYAKRLNVWHYLEE